jgi:hypothetical protein
MAYPVHYVPAGDVLPIFFDTFDGGTGASITMTGLAVTDIEIYKDGSVTQRASDAGYTLLDTDGIDFDSLTGIHGFSIDTGDNTDAGFYTVGSWFHVVVSAVTVDAQTVSFVAAAFRIMAAEGVAGVPDVNATHWNDTAVTTPPAVNVTQLSGDSTAADNAEAFFDGTGYAGTNNVIPSVTTVTGNVNGSVGSVTGAVGSVTGAVGSVTGNVGGSVASVATGGISEASFATTAGSFAPLGVLDQGTAQSATGTTIVLRSAAGFANDELIGATVYIVSGTGAGQSRVITDYVGSTDTATVDTWTTTPSGTIVYKIFATPPASATAVPAVNLVQVAGSTTDVSALATNVAAILVDTGTTLDGKLNTIDDFLDTEIAAILADTNELQTDWANGGRLDLLLDGAASAGDPWTTTLPGAYGAGTAGYIVGTNVNATVSSRASQTSVDTIDDFLDTEVAAILADTNELQTDWANGGRLDLILDARASQTSVDTIDDFLDTEIAAIKAKTDSLTFTAANKVDANVLNVNSQDIGATKPYDTAT